KGRIGSPRRAVTALLKAKSGSSTRTTGVPCGAAMPGAAITAPGRGSSSSGSYFLSAMKQPCWLLALSTRRTPVMSRSPSPCSLPPHTCAWSLSFMAVPVCALLVPGRHGSAVFAQQADGHFLTDGRVQLAAHPDRERVLPRREV